MQGMVLAYRLILVDGILFVLGVVLAFGAVTVLGRRAWAGLPTGESLAARLAAALLLGAIATGVVAVASTLILLLGGPPDAVADPARVQTARVLAIIGDLVALALGAAAVARIEAHHRQAIGSRRPGDTEEAEWIDDRRL